jgi:hypothetical protein
MRRGVRNELRILRELTNHFMTGGHVRRDKQGHAVCYFTGIRLFKNPSTEFGHHNHLKVREAIVVHHRNGDHDDNRPKNRTLALRSAHKSYHMKLQHKNGGLKRWAKKGSN